MDKDKVLIELDATAVAQLRRLMSRFEVRRIDEMIATAIGVMDAIKDFVHDGAVTVVDPNETSSDPFDREVDLVFEHLRRSKSSREVVKQDD